MPTHHFPERLLQLIWEKQYVDPARLLTTDGRRVQVLHPGRVSLESGPDVRATRVRIGDTVFTGDVEIHRTAEEWNDHGHSTDPRYNGVILHVLLHAPQKPVSVTTESGRPLHTLVLENALVRPLEEIRRDLLFDELDLLSGRLHCSGQNDHVPASVLTSLLDRLAVERIEVKLRRLEERLHELARLSSRTLRETSTHWGEPDEIPPPFHETEISELSRRGLWEQLLYEGIMEGLGYDRNRKPFLRLSQILTLDRIAELAHDPIQTESLLFGVSGLLPSVESVEDTESRTYLHVLHTEWNLQRQQYNSGILHRSEWVRSPTRPFNSPITRLVAARVLVRRILTDDLLGALFHIMKNQKRGVRRQLQQVLAVDAGPFWERRVSFARVVPGGVRLLGETRRDDLIINTVVPLFLLFARIYRDDAMYDSVERMLLTYPPSQTNTITRRVTRHLLRAKVPLGSASRQQAAIQLFNYYCSTGRCAECEVGRFVWGEKRDG